MKDEALMEKYGLSIKGLESLFGKLVEAGLLKHAELDHRKSAATQTAKKQKVQPRTQDRAAASLDREEKNATGKEPKARFMEQMPWECPVCGQVQAKIPGKCPECGEVFQELMVKSDIENTDRSIGDGRVKEELDERTHPPTREGPKERIEKPVTAPKGELQHLRAGKFRRTWSSYRIYLFTLIAIAAVIGVVSLWMSADAPLSGLFPRAGNDPVSIERETKRWLAAIRAIRPSGGSEAINRYNKQLDDAWDFFRANEPSVLPILRIELSRELQKESPNQMFLLDIGYFIRLQKDQSDKELGREAFFAIDPDNEVVKWNGQQLFRFAHAVVPDRDPRTLPFLDRAFLHGNVTAFIPQHYLSLDETLVCVFLYGIFGEGAEEHLRSQLEDRSIVQRVIEILTWIGSPNSVPEVKAAMMASRDHDTFVRATAFMMKAGGPQGRAAMLSLPIAGFNEKSQQHYARVRSNIEATTCEVLQKQFDDFPNPGHVSDAELRIRLSSMYDNYGRDDKTNPRLFLMCGLPKTYLITELLGIRARMFFRVSDEALNDVQVTNRLLNALYYKP